MPRPSPHLSSRLAAERASGHDRIAAVLGSEIVRGVHSPETNMPSELELIERFDVSRTVMREVMKTLSAKGLVVCKTRVGTRVRDPAYWNFFDTDVLAWRIQAGVDDKFLQNLQEIRCALEPAAAALAAGRRTAADVLRLRGHVRQMGRSGHSRQSFAEADLEFHLAIGAAAGNGLMRSVASVIKTTLLASCLHSSAVDDPGDHERNVNSHAAIVDAIEARNEQAAAKAMLKVIAAGIQRIATAKSRVKSRSPVSRG